MPRAQGRAALNTVHRDGGQENQSGHAEGGRASIPVGQPIGAVGEAARAARLARLQMEDLGADRAEAILTRDRGRDFDRSEVDRVEANRLSNIPGTAEWQEAQRNAPLLNAWAALMIEETDKKDLADGQGHRITRQRAQDAQAAAAPTAPKVHSGRGGHAHGGARGGGVFGTRGRGGNQRGSGQQLPAPSSLGIQASRHQPARPAPAIPAGGNSDRGTSMQVPIPSGSSRTARKRRQRQRKRLSPASAPPSAPRGPAQGREPPKAATGVTSSSQPREAQIKEPTASVAGPTHRVPSRPYVLADRDQFMAGYLAAVAPDNTFRGQPVRSSPSAVPVRPAALAPLQPRISPARPPLSSAPPPSLPPPPSSRLPVGPRPQVASDREASKGILGDRSPKHHKSFKTTGRPLIDVPEHRLEGPPVDIFFDGKPVTDLLDNFDGDRTVENSQDNSVGDSISTLENTIAELRAVARALPDPTVVLESIAFLQIQLDQAFTEAVLGIDSEVPSTSAWPPLEPVIATSTVQHSSGLSAVQEVSDEDDLCNDDEHSNDDQMSNEDRASSTHEPHSTHESPSKDEAHSMDEAHSIDEASSTHEPHTTHEPPSKDEAHSIDEASSTDETDSSDGALRDDEPPGDDELANEDGTTRIAPSPGIAMSSGGADDDSVHHVSRKYSQVSSSTEPHTQVQGHHPTGEQHESLEETFVPSTISCVQMTHSTTIRPDASRTVTTLRNREYSIALDTSESEELSQSLRNLHISSRSDRLHEDNDEMPVSRSHLSDHRDVASSNLPETDTSDFPASSTDIEHLYPLQGTVADLPTPTAITSPFLTTSTHEPHVLVTPNERPPTSSTPFEGSSSLAHVYQGAPNLPTVSATELQTSSDAPEAAIPAAGAQTLDSDSGKTLHESCHSSNTPEAAIPAAGAQIIESGYGETLRSSRRSSNAPEAAIPVAGVQAINPSFGENLHSSRRSSNAPEVAVPAAGARTIGSGFGENLRQSRHSSLSTHGQPSPTYPDAPNTSSTHNVFSGGVLTSRWSTPNQAVPTKQETKTRSKYPAFTTNRHSRRGGVHHLPAWLQESALPQSTDPGAAARAQYRERENLNPNRPHSERSGLSEAKEDPEE